MHALSLTRTALALVSIASLSIAICPGYNYGFINAGISAGGNNVWWIVDDFCDSVDACYNRNPCTCSNLGCSSAPVHVDRVKVNNLWYVIIHLWPASFSSVFNYRLKYALWI